MLRPLLLVRGQLRLRFFLLSRVHVSLTQPVVRIGNIGIFFQGFQIFGDRIGIARLVRKKVSQLEMRVAELRIEGSRLCKQCLDLPKIGAWILCALSFPHAHGVVVRSARIVRVQV